MEIIKMICDGGFFAAFIACICCTFKWLWLCIRHREDMKARKRYSLTAVILGVISGLFLTASFAAGIALFG